MIPATTTDSRSAAARPGRRAGPAFRPPTPSPHPLHRSNKPTNTAANSPALITKTFPSPPGSCPKHLRQDFLNVYAYCRISDDLGDEVGDPAASLALLDQWQAELDACYNGNPRHPVFVALAETVKKFSIPKARIL